MSTTAPDPSGAPARPGEPRPWEEAEPLVAKPEGVPYGYVTPRGEGVQATPEQLVALCRAGNAPPYVWTPESPYVVRPWAVPFLLDVFRERMAADARKNQRLAIGVSVVLTLATAVLVHPAIALVTGLMLAGWVSFVGRRRDRAEEITADDFTRDVQRARQADWTIRQPAPYTMALAAAIVAVGATQLTGLNESVAAAGLVKSLTREGEWWRLLTAAFLHGIPFHIIMNLGALLSLGRLAEAHAPRAWLPIVFLAAALGGGVASLVLLPRGASIGASGGLLGVIGFLAVVGQRRKEQLPPGFRKEMLIDLVVVAVFGIVGFAFIDNAGHAGGVVTGGLIGLLAVPTVARAPAWKESPALRLAGFAALAVLFAGAASAAFLILMNALG